MSEAPKPRLVGINHVAIEVGNIDEALAWYGRLFDFKLRGRGERSAFIDMGDQFINLSLVPDHAASGVEKRHIGLVVDDRSHVIDLAKAAGARFVDGPFLDFLDPWGNRLEIIEYANIQFTKAPNVMRGMGLALTKNEKASKELADKGMAESTERRAAKGFIVPASGGKQYVEKPGHFGALKLLGHDTGESVMMFEQTVPPGAKSWLHLHRDSDEIAWVLEGEFTFKVGDEVGAGGPGTCAFLPRNVLHAWKNSGSEAGRVLFLYTPAAAGHFLEEMVDDLGRSLTDEESRERLQRHRWEVVGPNPL
jgi:quercetin dioxygenase-like cupin family protein/catechol 2,3-dioxygenase-like lactoylglutathione lyase family enzyme